MDFISRLGTMRGVTADNLDQNWAELSAAISDPEAAADAANLKMAEAAAAIRRYLAVKKYTDTSTEVRYPIAADLLNQVEALFQAW